MTFCFTCYFKVSGIVKQSSFVCCVICTVLIFVILTSKKKWSSNSFLSFYNKLVLCWNVPYNYSHVQIYLFDQIVTAIGRLV